MGVIKVARPPEDKNIFTLVIAYIVTISKGMFLTMKIFIKQLFKLEKTETIEWPEQDAPYSERFKGKHFLTKRPDGQVRCTACFLCATNCPADCIHIEAGQHKDNNIEKYPIRFEIDILRCVFCGYCEEACPVDAIRLGPEYAIAGTTDQKWVYTKDHLIDRRELSGGIPSIKPETEKHPTINDNPDESEHKSYVRFGNH